MNMLADNLSNFSLFLIALIVLFVAAYTYLKQGRVLPPGPPGIHVEASPYVYKKFHEYAKIYGPVFSVRHRRQLLVVIASYKAAVEIMQNHGSELADRPRSIAAGNLLSGGMRVLLSGKGDRLKRMRRALHSHLQISVVKQYHPMIFKFSKLYILDILNQPEHHMDHAKKYSATVTLSFTYGKVTPTLLSDPEVHTLNMLVYRLGDCLRTGAYFVETFPFLQYLPIPEVKRLQRYHHEELTLFKDYVETVRENMSNEKTLPQNFSAYLIDSQDHLRLSDNELAYLAGTVFEAGSDTTASAMSFIVMAAACFPSEVLKVQEQLDAVVGRTRAPNFEDEEHLPLVTAFYQETHRWRPIGPSGFAHRSTKDIPWNDFVIPAGATVVGNHWYVLHDPEAFPDPERFELCRWLDENGHIKNNPKMYGFGFGRRACPGQVVAERSLFINTALLLWSFQITEDPSAPIDTMGFTDGPVARPFPFKAIFKPRIEALTAVLQ